MPGPLWYGCATIYTGAKANQTENRPWRRIRRFIIPVADYAK